MFLSRPLCHAAPTGTSRDDRGGGSNPSFASQLIPRRSGILDMKGAHRALCPRYAESRLFSSRFPDGQGDRNPQIPTQSKTSDTAILHTENAVLLSKPAAFALRTYASLVVGGLQGGHGKTN